MKIRNFGLLLIGLLSNNVFAIEEERWVEPSNIEYISVQPNSNIYVKLQGDTPDLGCPGNTEGTLQLNPEYPNFKEQFSLLTVAHLANRKVKIYVKSCGHFPYAQNTVVY